MIWTLTCAFLQAAGPLSVHPQLAVEVLLPELGEPHVPPVVGERAAAEVPIERCKGGGDWKNGVKGRTSSGKHLPSLAVEWIFTRRLL